MSQQVGYIVGNRAKKRTLNVSAGSFISGVSMSHLNNTYSISSNSYMSQDISPSESVTLSAELPVDNMGVKTYHDGLQPKEGNYYYTPITNYTFDGWYDGNDTLVSDNIEYIFQMPTINLSLTAVGTETVTESDRADAISITLENMSPDILSSVSGTTAYTTNSDPTSAVSYIYQGENITISGTGIAPIESGTVTYSADCYKSGSYYYPTSPQSYVEHEVIAYYISSIEDNDGNTISDISNNTTVAAPMSAKTYSIYGSSGSTYTKEYAQTSEYYTNSYSLTYNLLTTTSMYSDQTNLSLTKMGKVYWQNTTNRASTYSSTLKQSTWTLYMDERTERMTLSSSSSWNLGSQSVEYLGTTSTKQHTYVFNNAYYILPNKDGSTGPVVTDVYTTNVCVSTCVAVESKHYYYTSNDLVFLANDPINRVASVLYGSQAIKSSTTMNMTFQVDKRFYSLDSRTYYQSQSTATVTRRVSKTIMSGSEILVYTKINYYTTTRYKSTTYAKAIYTTYQDYSSYTITRGDYYNQRTITAYRVMNQNGGSSVFSTGMDVLLNASDATASYRNKKTAYNSNNRTDYIYATMYFEGWKYAVGNYGPQPNYRNETYSISSGGPGFSSGTYTSNNYGDVITYSWYNGRKYATTYTCGIISDAELYLNYNHTFSHIANYAGVTYTFPNGTYGLLMRNSNYEFLTTEYYHTNTCTGLWYINTEIDPSYNFTFINTKYTSLLSATETISYSAPHIEPVVKGPFGQPYAVSSYSESFK